MTRLIISLASVVAIASASQLTSMAPSTGALAQLKAKAASKSKTKFIFTAGAITAYTTAKTYADVFCELWANKKELTILAQAGWKASIAAFQEGQKILEDPGKAMTLYTAEANKRAAKLKAELGRAKRAAEANNDVRRAASKAKAEEKTRAANAKLAKLTSGWWAQTSSQTFTKEDQKAISKLLALEQGSSNYDKALRDVISVMIKIVKESPIGAKLDAAKEIQDFFIARENGEPMKFDKTMDFGCAVNEFLPSPSSVARGLFKGAAKVLSKGVGKAVGGQVATQAAKLAAKNTMSSTAAKALAKKGALKIAKDKFTLAAMKRAKTAASKMVVNLKKAVKSCVAQAKQMLTDKAKAMAIAEAEKQAQAAVDAAGSFAQTSATLKKATRFAQTSTKANKKACKSAYDNCFSKYQDYYTKAIAAKEQVEHVKLLAAQVKACREKGLKGDALDDCNSDYAVQIEENAEGKFLVAKALGEEVKEAAEDEDEDKNC